ncbi:MAG TPA: Ig-like domain-containing protein, partial [bacterium]
MAPLLTLLLLGGCAKQGYPPGGPEDRLGPIVVSSAPAAQAIAVSTDVRPWIRLSEYPQVASVESAIFISPEPEGGYAVKIRGKRIEIRFKQTLPDNRTVVVTFGSGIKDLRGNQMEESFILAFSTGDSLDQGIISGKLENMENSAAAWIWAYPLSDTPDPDPRQDKAPFAVQPQTDGRFTLSHLPQGLYRIFGAVDSRRDRFWQPETEAFAFAPRDITAVTESPGSLNLKLDLCDLEAPRLMGAQSIHRQGLRLSFNEPVLIGAARVTASTRTEIRDLELPIISVYQNPADSAAVLLTTAIQREGDTYNIRLIGISDRSGNRADSLTAEILATTQPDTLGPRLTWSQPADVSRFVDLNTDILIGFTEAITLTDLPRAIHLLDTSGIAVEGRWSYPGPALASFKLASPLVGGIAYALICSGDSLRDIFSNSSLDSLVTIRFQTLDPQETGSLSGTVSQAPADLKLVIESMGREPFSSQTSIQKDGSFIFDNVPAGDFRIWLYQDLNANGRPDAGRLEPFTFAEPFSTGLDSLRIRA